MGLAKAWACLRGGMRLVLCLSLACAPGPEDEGHEPGTGPEAPNVATGSAPSPAEDDAPRAADDEACVTQRLRPRPWPPDEAEGASSVLANADRYAEAAPGSCETPATLLAPAATSEPISGSVRRGPAGAFEFVPRAARDAVFVEGYLIVATNAGLFAHDAATLKLLARLTVAPARSVAVHNGTLATLSEAGTLRIGPYAAPARWLRLRPNLDGATRVVALGSSRWPFAVIGQACVVLVSASGGRLRTRRLRTDETVRDIEVRPGTERAPSPDLAWVGTSNRLTRARGARRPQRHDGFLSRRDLWALALPRDGTADQRAGAAVGGDGSRVHFLRDVWSTEDATQRDAPLDTPGDIRVLEYADRGELLVATDAGYLRWEGGHARRGDTIAALGPLLTPPLYAPITAHRFRSRSLVVTFMGRLFVWHPGGRLLRAADYENRVIVRTSVQVAPAPNRRLGVFAVGHTGGRIDVHRYPAEVAAHTTSTPLGGLPWHVVRQTGVAGDGTVVLVGAGSDGSEVAFVRDDRVIRVPGPDSLEGSRDSWIVAHPDGRRFYVHDRRGRVFEVDAGLHSWRDYGWIDPPDPDATLTLVRGAPRARYPTGTVRALRLVQ